MNAKCGLCGGEFTKSGMTRHLGSCLVTHASGGSPAKGKVAAFHVKVEAKYDKTYWLHLHAPADATLADLDAFLRRIWLECCGHLSEFSSAGVRYTDLSGWDNEIGDAEDIRVPLRRVLFPGAKLDYVYDFGSSTDLVLTVVAAAPPLPQTGRSSIRVLARNPPPDLKCVECGKPATQVCAECAWDGNGWLCDECLVDHPCGDEMALPVVNSPRMGVCGYTGDAA